jgi:glutathionylspermidine synthase
MNSDTPSGEAEAVLVNALLHSHYPDTYNPNENFQEHFLDMIRSFEFVQVNQENHVKTLAQHTSTAEHGSNSRATPTLGIVYPTDIPEDLSMILLYKQWLEGAGFRVITGSPFNLVPNSFGQVTMFGEVLNIVLRHYKTDWWGERESVWQDGSSYPDAEPLGEQLRTILDAEFNGRCAVVNPFGAVLTQNKNSMAFLWEHINVFSAAAQATIRQYIPQTYRLCNVNAHTFNKNDWVLKSDYGCEGDEVIIGHNVTDDIWAQSLNVAHAERWILQRFFHATPLAIHSRQGIQDYIPNYGVYIIGGKAAGIYTRLSPIATDYRALSLATFVVKNPAAQGFAA